MSDDWVSLIIVIVCLLLSAFFAGSETALMTSSRSVRWRGRRAWMVFWSRTCLWKRLARICEPCASSLVQRRQANQSVDDGTECRSLAEFHTENSGHQVEVRNRSRATGSCGGISQGFKEAVIRAPRATTR